VIKYWHSLHFITIEDRIKTPSCFTSIAFI
jgi:hypothetical protein